MGADFFYRIGSTHAVCQDYALAGERGGVEYAIVSDGCSGVPIPGEPGSPFTEYGARFLCRAAQRRVREIAASFFREREIITEAADCARLLGLPSVSLQATLVVACREVGGRYARVFHSGDGVVARRDRTGLISYLSPEFGNNMPFYLSYLLNDDALDRYLREAASVTTTLGTKHNDEPWRKVEWHQGLESYKTVEDSIVDTAATDLVLVCTDGVKSFTDADGQPVPLESVMEQLFAVKVLQGQFMARRCRAFLDRFCAERGWKHADDFSVAALYLGETQS